MSPQTKHIVLWLGLVLGLPLAGPYVLNGVFFRPPPRPSTVPATAVPFRQGADSLWWWADCPGPEAGVYACRLYDERGSLAVSGRFRPEPRRYTSDDAEHDGFCRPDAAKRRFGQYSGAEIYAQPGCVFVAREWLYFPSRGKKAAVSSVGGSTSLAAEVPMTEEERAAF